MKAGFFSYPGGFAGFSLHPGITGPLESRFSDSFVGHPYILTFDYFHEVK